MPRGDGSQQRLPGARKRDRRPEKIAARVAKFVDPYRVTREVVRGKDIGGTTPLNRGFFKLERMRAATVVKARGKKRRAAEGQR